MLGNATASSYSATELQQPDKPTTSPHNPLYICTVHLGWCQKCNLGGGEWPADEAKTIHSRV